jgi:ankyrin repeat protein
MKTTRLFLLIITLFTFIGCGDKDKSKRAEAPNVGIHQAIIMGDTEAVQQHIEAGSDLDEDEWTHGSSPLITASAFGEIESVKLLIGGGADINFQNDEGSTPLITAIAFQNSDIAQLFIDSGANVDIINNDGSTALILASLYGYVDIVKSLLDKGADKDIKNIYGRSAVIIAETPFEELKELYSALEEGLKIEFDYERIKNARPVIAEMLKGNSDLGK